MLKWFLFGTVFLGLFNSSILSAGYPVKKDKSNEAPAELISNCSDDILDAWKTRNPIEVLRTKVKEFKNKDSSEGSSISGVAWGITSLIFGIGGVLWFGVIGFPLALCAVVFGAIGLKKKFKIFAIAGFVLGVYVIVLLLLVLAALTIPYW